MKIAQRALIVLAAYACAVLSAIVPILGIGVATSPSLRAPNTDEFLLAVGLFSAVAAVYALPVAIPVIGYTEFKRRAKLRTLLASGVLLGILMAAAFTEVPFRGINFTFATTLLSSAVLGALTYWLFAWKLLPPTEKPQPSAET